MLIEIRRLVAGALLCLAGVVSAHAAVISIESSSTSAVVGDSLLVSVRISDLLDGAAPSISSFDLSLAYDPTVLSVTSVEFGDGLDVLGLGGNPRDVSTASGLLSVFELSLDTVEDLNALQSGAFALFTVTLQAIGTGTSALALTQHSLVDAAGASLTATLQNASITVAPVPLPAAAWLLLSGVAGLAGIGRRALRASAPNARASADRM